MTIAIRIVAAYLVLLAVAVAVNFIATPLYHPGGDEPFTVWEVLNWFMAVGILMNDHRRLRADPALMLALECLSGDPLASAATLNRLELSPPSSHSGPSARSTPTIRPI